jgi:hypothetical protein
MLCTQDCNTLVHMLSNIPTLTLPLPHLPSRDAHTEPDNDHLQVFHAFAFVSTFSKRVIALLLPNYHYLALCMYVSFKSKRVVVLQGWECNRGTGVLSVHDNLHLYGSAYNRYTSILFYTRGLGLVNVFYMSWLLNLTVFPWLFTVGNHTRVHY